MALGGIGGMVRWRGAPPPPDTGARLLEPIRHRGPLGLVWGVRGAVALGGATLIAERAPRRAPADPWAGDARLAVAADARLFNERELRRRLGDGIATGGGTRELLRAGYRRWGQGLVERLDGEFALAIWDARRDRLLLARDPFGARPLFYRNDRTQTLFGSEPKQILLSAGEPPEPDPLVLGEYLLGRFEELDRTFFRGVRRLLPGHLLVLESGRGRPRPYWLPRPGDGPAGGELKRFRAGLERSVRRRLLPGGATAAHLSGGLDSTSVVLSAARLRGAALTAVSCRFPGLACDETSYIEQVAAAVPFPHRFVEPLGRDPLAGLDEDLWRLDSPFADLQRGQFLALDAAIRESGARVVLTGLGGDELVLEETYLQDLAIRRRWGRLAVEALLASRYTRDGLADLVRDGLRPVAPARLRRLYRRLRSRRGWQPPAWATPEFVDAFRSLPEPPRSPHAGFPSRTQDTILRNVQHPEVCWAVEALECRAAERGYLPSHPFLDRSLVELVLAMPFERRLPRGRWKRLLRDGLAETLPPAVRERRGKTVFDSLDRHLMARLWPRLRARVLDGGEWRSAPYVSRQGAEALFARCAAGGWADARLRHDLWRVSTVELWLRQLGRYNATREHAADPATQRRATVAAERF